MPHPTRTLFRSLAKAPRVTTAKRKWTSVLLLPLRTPTQSSSTSIRRTANYQSRGFSSRPSFGASQNTEKDDEDAIPERLPEVDPSQYLQPREPLTVADLDPQERANYETLPTYEQEKYLGLQNHYKAMFEDPDADFETDEFERALARLKSEMNKGESLMEDRLPPLKPSEVGLFAEDDPDPFAQLEDADDDWDESMITSIAESELQLHREIREYTRMAAWDMPLLTSKSNSFLQFYNH
jgi:hypothetical protein